jgi:hypothetical protein
VTTQPDLFAPWTDVRSTQTELFAGLPVVAAVRCECGRQLIETDQYLICPKCLGKLIPDVPDAEHSGRWFEDDER